jgi:hypothetical protein
MNSRLQRIAEPLSGGTRLSRLSRHDIERLVSRSAVAKGERYWRQGRVLSLSVEQDTAQISARVQGSRRQPYSCTIDIGEADGGRLDIEGECSCPVSFDCKHVAAALFAAIAQNSSGSHQPRPAHAKSNWAGRSAELFPCTWSNDIGSWITKPRKKRWNGTQKRIKYWGPETRTIEASICSCNSWSRMKADLDLPGDRR